MPADAEKGTLAGPEAAPGREDELARLQVRLSAVEFERDQARAAVRRLEDEIRRLEQNLADVRADTASLKGQLDERAVYVEAIHNSAGWKALQSIRGLFGRRWWS